DRKPDGRDAMHLEYPWIMTALLIIPFLVRRYLVNYSGGRESLRFPSTAALEHIRPHWTVSSRHVLFGACMIALAMAITALARPQQGIQQEEIIYEGIDIIIALDASGSMAAEDFTPRNRFHVAKLAVKTFVQGLRNDRVGLVVFAGKAYTRCPPTLDRKALLEVLDRIELGEIEDGTAIGSALAVSLNRLRYSDARSKAIILVTDGVSNRGELQPLDAAQMAASLGVRIYTVGIGSSGLARFPLQDPVYGKTYTEMPVEIDEHSLKQIADITGGRYYRATDRPVMETIFEDIGSLEKSKVGTVTHTRNRELFPFFLLPALAIVFLAKCAELTRFARIP
ncbi:MAG TPA: VWA domain-containing protein, partial [Acidobacteriota bacterium]|nr:VWA domain-containing protein [Acidobacteriota bacterium]